MSALVLAWWMAGPPSLREVRSERVEGRPALVVVVAAPLLDATVRRDGAEVVVSLAATAPASLSAPQVAAPLEAVRIERTPDGVRVRVRVAPEVPYELRREMERLVLIFGAAAAVAPTPSSAELYRGLFPPSATGDEAGIRSGDTSPGAPPPPDPVPEQRREGFRVGSLIVKPSVTLDYVDADVSLLDTPEPVRDRYAQARPALGLELPLRDGLLQLGYEARIRRYSSFEEVNGVSHRADGRLQYPAGPAISLRGTGHFARGFLETAEVDPGGEYFFELGHYTRQQFGAGVRFDTGGRFDVDVAGGLDKVTVDDDAGFFDYERRSVTGGVGVEVGPDRRASVVYGFEQVPASPERPQSESRVHSISGAVEGEILPLLSGRASAGYTRRESPRAGPGGRLYRGLTFGAQLTRDFGRSARLVLTANRSTELSAFEENAFYVSSSIQAVLTAPLPLSFSLTAGGGYHVNRYPTAASATGLPRRDAITYWLAGVGRTLSRWAFVRADYRHDRRDSNLDFFDQGTHAFYAELGLGFFGEGTRR